MYTQKKAVPPGYMYEAQVAHYLKVSRQRVSFWRRNGGASNVSPVPFPRPAKIVAGRALWLRSEIAEWKVLLERSRDPRYAL